MVISHCHLTCSARKGEEKPSSPPPLPPPFPDLLPFNQAHLTVQPLYLLHQVLAVLLRQARTAAPRRPLQLQHLRTTGVAPTNGQRGVRSIPRRLLRNQHGSARR